MESRFYTHLRSLRYSGYFLAFWAAAVAGAALWADIQWPGQLMRGIAPTAIALSLVQFWSGTHRIVQAWKLGKELLPIVRVSPPSFAALELPRLDRTDRAYQVKRNIEQALFVMGLCFTLSGVFQLSGRFLMGMGLAICLQTAVLLVSTLIGQWQNAMYRHELEREKHP
ncbi:MAG: hypothetical protein KDC66_02145 [Phaeodactylibacter sp.]|nr:hypothetical protein [Phaeodactylibacter sp.]MCB9273437.1 hypothetical protein [Lewinellaceae bacterium]